MRSLAALGVIITHLAWPCSASASAVLSEPFGQHPQGGQAEENPLAILRRGASRRSVCGVQGLFIAQRCAGYEDDLSTIEVLTGISPIGHSILDLHDAAKTLGYRVRMSKYSRGIAKMQLPSVVFADKETSRGGGYVGHFFVLTCLDDGYATYIDPVEGDVRCATIPHFETVISGHCLEFLEPTPPVPAKTWCLVLIGGIVAGLFLAFRGRSARCVALVALAVVSAPATFGSPIQASAESIDWRGPLFESANCAYQFAAFHFTAPKEKRLLDLGRDGPVSLLDIHEGLLDGGFPTVLRSFSSPKELKGMLPVITHVFNDTAGGAGPVLVLNVDDRGVEMLSGAFSHIISSDWEDFLLNWSGICIVPERPRSGLLGWGTLSTFLIVNTLLVAVFATALRFRGRGTA